VTRKTKTPPGRGRATGHFSYRLLYVVGFEDQDLVFNFPRKKGPQGTIPWGRMPNPPVTFGGARCRARL
jgi:hypothetical protein